MPLHLYDTLTREKRPFEPREAGKASMYVCGPTVQAEAHVGHGRAAVVFDVLRRYLVWSGSEVLAVTNVTDVDDKIIIRAGREGTTPSIIATRYLRAWNDAMARIGVLPPDVQPLATGHILEMQELIQLLIDEDKAYVADGNVLFRVRRFEGYGKLSGRDIDEMVSQDDVVGAEGKDDPLDFAMWKAAKPDEPSWPSPWGPGRPGWHIECSAMAAKHLGHGFDIHGGGLDLVFPHHENEVAQHEAAHGAPFARHWVHNGMVRMGEEKMSKSLGNIVSLVEAEERWGRDALRLWYLSAHHRSPLTFEDAYLDEGGAAFERLATWLRTARLVVPDEPGDTPASHDAVTGPHREAFAAAMDDDLNAPKAVAALHELVSDGYERLKGAEGGDAEAAAAVRALADTLTELGDEVLGLDLAGTVARDRARGERLAPLVTSLLDDRASARAEKDFATSDRIRDELAAIGIVVEDRPGGVRWYATS
ncbi:MAG: cysteine--tRNA ligase [Actinobacteria bacterium]|nr:cysteine--tRNA ligase [Actinomycetota bacterium]